MWDLPEAPEIIVAFGTLLAGTAACVGVFVALSGLNTWKKQNSWHHGYELAIALYGTFRQRRAISHYIRSPHSNPPLLDDESLEQEIRDQRKKNNRIGIQLLYWRASKDIEISQARLFDEAKLRWELDFEKFSQKIIDLEYELICTLDDVIAAQGGTFSPTREQQNEIDAILSSARDKTNKRGEYDECFKNIEAVLKPKIVIS